MESMEELDGIITFDSLVMAPEEVEPYVLRFYPGPEEDGLLECFALCILRREGGVLLAVPDGVFPPELLAEANQDGATGVFGPCCTVEVAAIILDNGVASPTGEKISVVLIDCQKEVVEYLSLPGILEEIDYGFAEDQPYALPSPEELVVKATGWISVATQERVGYYSAEEMNSAPEEGEIPALPQRKKKPGGGRPTGNAKNVPKPKRPTTASLAASLDSLMAAIPTLTTQVQSLQDRQVKFEERLAAAPMKTHSQLAQPLSSLLQTPPRSTLDQVARHMTPPPRTTSSPALGILAPLTEKPAMVKELEEGSSRLSPKPGVDHPGLSDSISKFRPDDGVDRSWIVNRQQRSSRSCSPPSRVSTTSWQLLHFGSPGHGKTYGPHQLHRNHLSGDAIRRNFRDQVCGEVRRLWEDEGMGPTSVSSDDGPGLLDGRQHRCGQGHGGSFGCDPRTGPRWWFGWK